MAQRRTIVLSPNDRLSIVGKTGSGKTVASVVLACLLVPHDDPDWEIWWADSKLDPDDIAMLRQWGFGRISSRKHFPLVNDAAGPVWYKAQMLAQKAMQRGRVLLVFDEYKHVCVSTRRAGDGIEGVHLRGRGLNVGLLGETQEPVEIPRQLLSQATHLFLFDVHYPADIKYVRTFYDRYERPPAVHVGGKERRIGFYHCHIDGDATWRYYPNIRVWHDRVTGHRKAEKVPQKQTA